MVAFAVYEEKHCLPFTRLDAEWCTAIISFTFHNNNHLFFHFYFRQQYSSILISLSTKKKLLIFNFHLPQVHRFPQQYDLFHFLQKSINIHLLLCLFFSSVCASSNIFRIKCRKWKLKEEINHYCCGKWKMKETTAFVVRESEKR